ncbi:MAG TPA: ribosomal L7Ae/L30e/S12e/Gadd45 family protein [Clostridia bacterium]|nr:ribosomal L7Ae/L30e/S12e/Gadd45 family protein [Clostridia bacterium]
MEKETNLEKMLITSSKVVGTKQVLRSIASDELRCVVISEDADETLKSKIINASDSAKIEVLYSPSMQWLGKTCEIAVGAAVVGILKN